MSDKPCVLLEKRAAGRESMAAALAISFLCLLVRSVVLGSCPGKEKILSYL